MHRFFINPHQISAQGVNFPPDVTHQILHVLRLSEGDSVEVLIDDGYSLLTKLHIDPEGKSVIGEVVERNFVKSEPRINLHLYFGLSNRDKVEWILQKSTEIGVSAFNPFVSSRTIVRDKKLPEKKRQRWERIIREAAEQSNRGRLPILNNPIELLDGISKSPTLAKQCFLAWEGADTQNDKLADVIFPQNEGVIAVFVGPEGGFAEDEIQQAKSSGIKMISLGSRILRLETAAIVFPALVLFALDEM